MKEKKWNFTPIGIYASSREAAFALGVSKTKILTIQKNLYSIFSIHSYKNAIGWFSNKENYIGKTYFEMGFGYMKK